MLHSRSTSGYWVSVLSHQGNSTNVGVGTTCPWRLARRGAIAMCIFLRHCGKVIPQPQPMYNPDGLGASLLMFVCSLSPNLVHCLAYHFKLNGFLNSFKTIQACLASSLDSLSTSLFPFFTTCSFSSSSLHLPFH